MTLEEAKSAITHTFGRMNAIYPNPVFDEWVLVSMAGRSGSILAYNGPRAESYQKRFVDDLSPLRVALASREQSVGDFEFAADGDGTRFDACLKTGPTSILLCNNTQKSMTEIRKDLRWIEAQKVFLQLSAKFRAHPLD